MLNQHSITPVAFVAALTLSGHVGCGIIGPTCIDETGVVMNVGQQARAGSEAVFEVTSPKSSNLVMRLTWTDPNAELSFRALIINCGGHVGCAMVTVTPPFGPGGPSPIPQPWPHGLREMEVDGWQGKTWRITVTGDATHDASFVLVVSYKIACES